MKANTTHPLSPAYDGVRFTDRRKLLALLALGSVLGVGPRLARAAQYPSRPIRVIVPYAPGGAPDVLTRALSQELSESLGQPLVIDNKPGASGMIGAAMVARAPADGYTLLVNASIHVINPSLYSKVEFDAMNDLTPVTQLSSAPLILVVNNDLPVTSVRELIAYAKVNPGKVNYASSGNGASNHLAAELFKKMSGAPMNHIPYKGSAAAMTDLMGGHVQVAFDSLPSALPHVKAGKLRALAVTGPQRSFAVPDLPTVAEAGVPGFDVGTWYGVWVPRSTPNELVNRLADEISKALKRPEVRERYLALGNTPVGSTPAQFAALCQQEFEKWARVVRDTGVRLD